MPKLLVMVHGMGVHPDGWSAPVLAKLDEVAQAYAFFRDGQAPSAQVTLAEVQYDDVFQQVLSGWTLAAAELERFGADERADVADLVEWLRGAEETEKNFFWSHTVDVALYYLFESVRTRVRVRVMKQIAEAVRAAGGNTAEVSVLAHSLGTAVAHDSLAVLGSTSLDGSEAFLAGKFQFQNLFMLANVSRCLETSPRTDASCVFPGALARSAYTSAYFNFRHELDPFLVVRTFRNPGWTKRYLEEVNLAHIRELNVHGFRHYLDHPLVHIPILQGIFGNVVTEEERTRALRQHATLPGPPCPERVQELRDFCRRTIALVQGDVDPTKLIVAGTQFFAKVKELADACR